MFAVDRDYCKVPWTATVHSDTQPGAQCEVTVRASDRESLQATRDGAFEPFSTAGNP